MNAPLITIGLTCYNAERSIGAALESALAQDWPNTEVVVVDDASTDDSVSVIRSFKGVRLHQQAVNRGVAAARNQLIERARGEFLAFFDDDDVSLPHRLSRQYQRIVAHESDFGDVPLLCHSARTQVYPDGAQRVEPTIGNAASCSAPGGIDAARRMLTGQPFDGGHGSLATCMQMGRIAVYRQLGGFDEAFRRGEDTELALRHALAGGAFPGIAEPLVKQTMTHGLEKTVAADFSGTLALYKKHAEFLRSIDPAGFNVGWVVAKQHYMAGRVAAFLAAMGGLALRHPAWTWRRLQWALPNRVARDRYRQFQAGNR